MLIIHALHKAFGEVVVARDITLEVPTGQTLGVLGPNGAGKSTLFNMISGLIVPDRGHISLEGKNISNLSVAKRAHIGIGRSFQIPKPFTEMSVYENLLVGATHGGEMSEKKALDYMKHILSECELEDFANQPAGSLSLLNRKRLELARALATVPKLLLLDEIAGGLTELEYIALIETLQRVKQQGITIIWIEHVVNALLSIADRLIVLNFGEIIADGNCDMVMHNSHVQEIYMGISV